MKRGLLLGLVTLLAALPFANLGATIQLAPLASFGSSYHGRGDGSIWPFEPTDWPLDTSNNQRGLAYDPTTGNLVWVNTGTGSEPGPLPPGGGVYILDGTYGTNITRLNTNGINYVATGYVISEAVVTEDGVVYVCNAPNASGTGPFLLYRWDSTTSTDPPYLAFSNTITPSQRYGISMKVRGTGTNTQIIIGSYAMSGSSGTNVVIFTTADGTNFTATSLATDVKTANFSKGLAWGVGNTFWAKNLGQPLRLMSFDLATATATTLRAYDFTQLPGTENLEPLAVDPVNHRLAAIKVTVGSVPEEVWLFDISDLNRGPVLLDVKTYGFAADSNPFAPYGVVEFAGSRLYSFVMNNGVVAYTLQSVPPAAPTFLIQPAVSNRVVSGATITLTTLAYPNATYQWQRFNTNLPNATNSFLIITNAQPGNSGTYRVVASNSGGSTASSNAYVTVVSLGDLYHLKPLWSVGAGAGQLYMNATGGAGTPNQRTIAYNALSNELYVVTRGGSGSANIMIYALPATNVSATPPPIIKTLKTNGISGGSIAPLVAIGVAEDGAIYACNADNTTAGSRWKLYRWANSDSNTLPVVVYDATVSGDPSGQATGFRWGDVLDVRGSGTNTQIIIDNQNTPRYVTVLKPTDASMTNFAITYNFLENTNGTLIGRSLQWGPGNTFYQKRSSTAPLVTSLFEHESGGIAWMQGVYSNVFRATTFGPVYLDFGRNVFVGIRTNANVPNSVELYDCSDLKNPLLIASYNFPQSPPQANNNYIGQCIIAGDYVFALAANNGLMAFRLAAGPPAPPEFVRQPKNLRLVEGGSGTLTALVDQSATFQWQKDGTNLVGATTNVYVISNAQLTHAGSYRLVASNQFGMSTSAVATVTVTPLSDVYQLSLIWSNAAGSVPYLGLTTNANTPSFRTLAFNPLANELYVINRTDHLDENLVIAVLNPATGALSHYMNTNGILSDGNSAVSLNLVGIGVSGDGSIYACNVSRSGTTGGPAVFRLYRWTNSAPTTPPVLVFEGEPAGSAATLRWGDVLDVRGAGINTEIVIDNERDHLQPVAAVLVPTDASLNTFVSKSFYRGYANMRVGRSLQFGVTNTIWQKSRGDRLELSRYDLDAGTSVLLTNYSEWPATLGGLALDFTRNLAVAVDFNGVSNAAPDTVKLYEISDLSTPMLIGTYAFPTNQQGNVNRISQCVFAGNRVFALNANNGLVAFDLVPPTKPSLAITWAPPNALLSWPGNFTGWTLQATPALTPPVVWTNVGGGTLVGGQFWVTNPASASSLFYRLAK